MMIKENDKLPNSEFVWFGKEGIEKVSLSKFTALNKVVIFGLPGAFTPTCQSSHVPSFIRTKKRFEEIDPKTSLLVGDTMHDAEIAAQFGANCILISHGHQAHRRLLDNPMRYPVVSNLNELRTLLS